VEKNISDSIMKHVKPKKTVNVRKRTWCPSLHTIYNITKNTRCHHGKIMKNI